MEKPPSVLVPGLLAGFAGAAVLALWFFLVDLVRGEPLASVTFLSSILTGNEPVAPTFAPIVLYTLFHFGVFGAVGILMAWFFDSGPFAPNWLMGFALGLLLFAGVFYAGILITGPEVIQALGWPQILIGNVLAGVAALETLRLLGPDREAGWLASIGENRVLRDGVVAGAIGATAVALWFFVPDLIQGRPFFTPAALGSALLHGVTDQEAVTVGAGTVLFFSIIHFGVWIGVALIASAILQSAESSPRILFFGMLFFAVLGAHFVGIIAIFAEWILGELAWWNLAFGTLLGAGATVYYLLRAHPRLREKLRAQESETVPPELPSGR